MKISISNILQIVGIPIETFSVNRLACAQPLCTILFNSLHCCKYFGETHVKIVSAKSPGGKGFNSKMSSTNNSLEIITARIPKEWGRYCFHRCVSVRTQGVGSPSTDKGGGTPIHPDRQRGTPILPGRQNSRANTCYAAGGMPLAFTQEDFLVHT